MIELPWQVVGFLFAWIIIGQLLNYMRKENLRELVRSERNDERRTTIATFRDTYRTAWRQALRDAKTNQDEQIRKIYMEMRDAETDSDS